MGTPPVIMNLWVDNAYRARLWLNDIPWWPLPMNGSHSLNAPINHRLVEGINEVRFSLERKGGAGDEADEPSGVGRNEQDRFSLGIFTSDLEDPETVDQLFPLFEYTAPAPWKKANPEGFVLPLHLTRTFEVPFVPPRMTFVDASPVTEVPCEGTPALRAAVDAVFDAFIARDTDRALEQMAAYVDDRCAAFSAYKTAGSIRASIASVLAEKPAFERPDPAELHFEAHAGGRVVSVRRYDGQQVLCGAGTKEFRYRTDLLLTQTSAGWRIM